MRISVLVGSVSLALLTAGCSAPERQQESADLKTYDVQEEPAAPGVNVTAAPGVAFNYRYAYRLPNNRISAVQEAHATACEKLGLDRCRITGMRYRLVDQKDIEAMLALRLDPKLARDFGKQATDMVAKADGMLVDQEISGEDVGTRIAGANRSERDLRDELAKVEAELNRPVPMVKGNVAPQAAVDRQSLLNRAEEIRQQLRNVSETRGADQEALAGTPMVLNYGSGSVVPGFDVRSPFKDALQRSADNFVGGLAAILVILVTVIPWVLLIALGVWLYRRLAPRFGWMGGGYIQERSNSAPIADERPARPRARVKRSQATE